MANLSIEQVDQIIKTTQRDQGRLKFEDMASELQRYTALPMLLNKSRIQEKTGHGIRFNMMVGQGTNARNADLNEVDVVVLPNNLDFGFVDFRLTQTAYGVSLIEMAANQGAEQLMDIVKTRRMAEWLGMAELMEKNWWGKPSGSTDLKTPYGVYYWVVPNATKGFNGQNPAGLSTIAGLDSSTVADGRWANYTDTFAEATKDDMIDALSEAAFETGWMSPMPFPTAAGGGSDTVLYMNYRTWNRFNRSGEAQNENLGKDVDSMAGKVVFQGHTLMPVPYFKDSANWDQDIPGGGTDPIYMINWKSFYVGFLKGFVGRESEPAEAPGKHLIRQSFIDFMWTPVCVRRQDQALLYKTGGAL